jgi:hypothetical protein
MVAICRSTAAPAAHNVVRKTARAQHVVEARTEERVPVTLKAWLCAEAFSARGFVLDLSPHGARLGGVGFRFREGERVLLKVQLDDAATPVVVRAEVVRADPVCVRFLDGAGPLIPVQPSDQSR